MGGVVKMFSSIFKEMILQDFYYNYYYFYSSYVSVDKIATKINELKYLEVERDEPLQEVCSRSWLASHR